MKYTATFASLLVSASATTLVGFASLPADSFAPGPSSGSQLDAVVNNRTTPFASQPVQGFSATQWSPFAKSVACERFLMMPDNGYGSRDSSPDYLLRMYDVEPNWRNNRKGVEVHSNPIQLSDPDGWFPHTIVNEETLHRNLTGSDMDIESFAIAHDATLWVGEEFGPWLTQHDLSGRMIRAPIETPEIDQDTFELDFSRTLRTKNHPQVLDGTFPETHGSSRGFEGMTFSPDRKTLYPILEDRNNNDPDYVSRMYEFSTEEQKYTRFVGFIPHNNRVEGRSHKIGDATPLNSTHFLVLIRDSSTDSRVAAGWERGPYKRIHLVDMTKRDEKGMLATTEIVDLLNINDPRDLNRDGNTTFTFPFLTIENVLVLSPRTLLVANDNNYPFTISRASGLIDDNEIIKVRLDEPLHYDFRYRNVPKVDC